MGVGYAAYPPPAIPADPTCSPSDVHRPVTIPDIATLPLQKYSDTSQTSKLPLHL